MHVSRYRMLGFIGVAIAMSVAIACGSTVPTPKYTSHPTSALVQVPYPPPPARAEVVPDQDTDGAVWIDGEWVWQTRRWAWRAGRWVVPPSGARFAPWTTVRDEDGTLFVATGAWRAADGSEVTEPEPLAKGKPRGASVVSPDGDEVPVGAPASSANARRVDRRDAAAGRDMEALDAAVLPSLSLDAAVTDQLLDASPSERAPTLPRAMLDASTP
ncbi:MAG: YXWGXW repeat-containing protein [Labilithrix sp.]|nr:YXWGXW repeat-containing protein [Labilithrix sp.]MCW5815594.1 YXWGXW repeat-containing protein [Labilithrix sp.]